MGLRELRREALLSIAEFSDLSGVSRPTIIGIEHGRIRSPHPSTLRRLATALSVPTTALAEHMQPSRDGVTR